MVMNKIGARNLSGFPSLFLDSLRLFASLAVMTAHAFQLLYPNLNGKGAGDWAHAAVVVFFVLSGFVIAHTTTANNRGGRSYIQARFSRLYSMVIPALIVTAIIEVIIAFYDPSLHASNSRGNSIPRYIITSFFLNEIWFFSATPVINGPLWSLSYEFWYYVLFGFFIFKFNGSYKYLITFLLLLIIGPKILLMMPIWLTGVLAYKLRRPSISTQTSWILISVFFLLFLSLIRIVPSYPYALGTKPLYFAAQFVTDIILGSIIGIVFWLLPTNSSKVYFSSFEKQFRKIADLSFPIYVFHKPLLVLSVLVINPRINDLGQFLVVFICVLLICSFLGVYFESKRPFWTLLCKNIINYILKQKHIVRLNSLVFTLKPGNENSVFKS